MVSIEQSCHGTQFWREELAPDGTARRFGGKSPVGGTHMTDIGKRVEGGGGGRGRGKKSGKRDSYGSGNQQKRN